MRRIRESLRLHLQAGLSYNEVGRALKISKSVVGKYVSLARAAGVDWDLAQTLSDEDLEARLYRPALTRASHQVVPDFGVVHQELKRANVTLMLLWEEYAMGNPLAYKYTSFCIKYREFARTKLRSMRQIHIAGEKLFVDYAGGSVPIIDATTGEISEAQIFVATLGASNYCYACATPRQTTLASTAAKRFAPAPAALVLPGTGTFHPGVLMPTKLQSLRRQAFAREGGRCFYCGVRIWLVSPDELPAASRSPGAPAKLKCTAEHLVPQSQGGRDTLANIAAACAHCNHTRHKRKEPPEPHAYQAEVRRRMKRGAWHQRWVHERGLAGFR